MKKTIFSFILLSSIAFASSRNEDLKVILEKGILSPRCEPLFNMYALEAIQNSEKPIDSEKLLEQFKEEIKKEAVLAKIGEPYQLFSDAEISELRKIHDQPLWDKFSEQGGAIFQAQMASMKGIFEGLAASYEEPIETKASKLSEVVEITQENLKEILASGKPVIIDVKASWCNPCQLMEPIVEQLSAAYKGEVIFGKIDFDTQSEIAKQYDVRSLPTLLFFKPGQTKPELRSVGLITKKDLESKISNFIDAL